MRKLLIILFTLVTVSASAQQTFDTIRLKVPIQRISLDNYFTKSETGNILGDYLLKSQGVTSIANNNTKDSLVYYVNDVRYAIPVATNAYSKSETDSISSLKVDKVSGKQLSTEDYTTAEKTKLSAITGTNTGDETTSSIKSKLGITVLSGSNTGDQDLSGLVTKTTTINTHPLSTNITLTKSDFSDLNNVDNTTDLNKPISTATQTALTAKANDNAVVHNTGAESIDGVKTFSGDILFGNGANSVIGLKYSGKPTVNMYLNSSTGKGGFGFNTRYNGDSSKYEILTAGWGGIGTILELTPTSGLDYSKITGGVGNPTTKTTLFKVDPSTGFITIFANDATGDFITRNSSTGLITKRTASEALSDMGGLSSATASSTYLPLAGGTITGDIVPNAAAVRSLGANPAGFLYGWIYQIVSPNILTLQSNGNQIQFKLGANVYGEMMAGGNLLLQSGGTYTDNGVDKLQVGGSILGTAFKKSGATSSQFLMGDGSVKTFGITAGTVADGQMVMDSLTALNARKLDTSFEQPLGAIYPIQFNTDSTFWLVPSFKDSIAYKVDVWSLTGDTTTSSLNKFLGYIVADSLQFKVKNGFSGIIDATNHNGGLGYLGFTNPGGNLANGSYNTWLGDGAGGGNNTTSDGVFIGASSHVTIDNSHYVIAIGSDATATKSYQTVIGTPNTLETKLYGIVLSGSDTMAKKKDLVSYATLIDLQNIYKSLKNKNFVNDSTAFVDGGLNQWDFYRTGNVVKVLTTLPYDTTMFNFIVDNRDGNSNTLKLRLKTYSASFSPVVYWGDGDSTVYSGAATYSAYHTYAGSGYYIAKVRVPTISDLRELYVNDTTKVIKIVGLFGLNKLTNLNVFGCSYSSLTNTIVDAINYGSTLTTIYFDHNNLTGFNTVLPTSVTYLTLSSNLIPSSAQLVLSPYLTTLKLGSEAPGGITWVSADVNTMLQYIDSKPFNTGAKSLEIRQFNSATPTGSGLTAKTNLTSEGWTVTTD